MQKSLKMVINIFFMSFCCHLDIKYEFPNTPFTNIVIGFYINKEQMVQSTQRPDVIMNESEVETA